jgi:hypothetical protein
MKNFNLWFFAKKWRWAEKGEFHFFKKHVFSQKSFLRFFTWEGLCQNEKIGLKKPCPQYNFCVKHKKLTFFAKQAGR